MGLRDLETTIPDFSKLKKVVPLAQLRSRWEARQRGALSRWLYIVVPWVILLVCAGARLAQPPAIEELQNRFFDHYQRLRPRPYEEAPVRIVDLDDETLKRLGQWPWPRTLVARLVERLTQSGASAVAFDIVFAEPDRTTASRMLPLWPQTQGLRAVRSALLALPDHDRLLGQELSRSPVVLGAVLTAESNASVPVVKAAFGFSGEDPAPYVIPFDGAVKNLPVLEETAAGSGAFNSITDSDGIIRRVPLVFRVGETLVPSLAAEALRVAQGASTIGIKTAGSSGEASFGARTGIARIKIGKLSVPTDENGRLLLYYTRPASGRTIPVWEVMDKGFDRSRLDGCIAVVGTSAAGLKDQRATPLSPMAPGVEVHAQALEQMLLGRFLERPDWADGAEVVYLVVLGSLLILLLYKFGAGWGLLIAGSAAVGAGVLSWLAFTRLGWLLDAVYPAAVILVIHAFVTVMSYLRSEGERRRVRGAFSRYMSPVLAEQLAAHPERLKLGGESKVMTFHFCDIAGFSTISEFYDPQGLIQFLNGFLTPMTEIILENHGTVDKYIGDCIMAYWNAPLDDPDHAQHALFAALGMHAALRGLNEERKAAAEAAGAKFVPVRIRTGLNTGSCIVGNMGSEHRFDYSVIGDDVNLASRLEGANKFFGTDIMASETTIQHASGAVEARELGRVRVVGKAVPIRVYQPLARKGALPEDWKKALPRYEEGVALYNGRQFERSLAAFREVLAVFPEDGPSFFYAKTIAEHIKEPPPADWDGVFNLSSK
ncbi:MAG: adenylate/guanylate cyclase domain-containing protein [Elusimicrobia bacterium]|nr:adenylate/guanylate cyclase domain-containing protein [Elusimicrobiota bacterium]